MKSWSTLKSWSINLPEKISSPDAIVAVSMLSHELEYAGVGTYGANAERICRLLGWMCNMSDGKFCDSVRSNSRGIE